MSGDGLAEHDATVQLDREIPIPVLIELVPQPPVIYPVAMQYPEFSETGRQTLDALPTRKQDIPVAAMRCGLY